MYYTQNSDLNKGFRIFKHSFKLSVIAILLLVFGCQKEEEDTSLPLSIVSTNIADGATDVDIFSDITVTFSDEMDVASVNEESFVVRKGQYPIYGKVSCSGKKAVFEPAQQLADKGVYNCTISTEVKGLNGVSMANDYQWRFTSDEEPDLIAPKLKKNMPLDHETLVLTNSSILVSFDEEINPESINGSSFIVKSGEAEVAGTYSYADKTASFTPDVGLTYGVEYTCVITTGIKDLAGNNLENNFEWSFTTISDVLRFSEIIQPIFDNSRCYSCHNGIQDPNLSGSNAHASLVNGNYVNTDSPAGSRLVMRLSGDHKGRVTVNEEALILEWITQGAQNN